MAAASATQCSEFSCRIVSIDYCMAAPVRGMDSSYSSISSCVAERVPVVRIFGSTPAGQKTCLHLHGAFPYLLVPSPSPHPPSDNWLQQLGRSINHALQVSLGVGSKEATHVQNISVVTGIPFYGYHESEHVFIKIFLYNPAFIKRLADLLLAGAVMNHILQPHESHIPFVLQVMIDHSLYGMNFIYVSDIKFRIGGEQSASSSKPTPLLSSSLPSSPSSIFLSPHQRVWNVTMLPNEMLLNELRESICELEVDTVIDNVLNTQLMKMSCGEYPGLAAIWEEERRRRAMLEMQTPLTQPSSPQRKCSLLYSTESRYLEKLHHVLNEIKSREFGSPSPSMSCDDVPLTMQREAAEEEEKEKDEGVVVDEEAVQYNMELTQRIQNTVLTPSDADLLNVLIELAHSSCASELTQRSRAVTSSCHSFSSSSSSSSLFTSTPQTTTKHGTSEPLLPIVEQGDDFGTVLSQLLMNEQIEKNDKEKEAVQIGLTETDIALFDSEVASYHDDDLIPGNQMHSQSPVKKSIKREEGDAVVEGKEGDTEGESDHHKVLFFSQPYAQKHGSQLSQGQFCAADHAPHLSQPSRSPQLTMLERRRLKQFFSTEVDREEWEMGDEEMENEKDKIQIEEMESLIMSQPVWDDIDPDRLVDELDGDLLQDSIPQIDGTSEEKAKQTSSHGMSFLKRNVGENCRKNDDSLSGMSSFSRQSRLSLSLKRHDRRKRKRHLVDEEVRNSVSSSEVKEEKKECGSTLHEANPMELTHSFSVRVPRLPAHIVMKYHHTLPVASSPDVHVTALFNTSSLTVLSSTASMLDDLVQKPVVNMCTSTTSLISTPPCDFTLCSRSPCSSGSSSICGTGRKKKERRKRKADSMDISNYENTDTKHPCTHKAAYEKEELREAMTESQKTCLSEGQERKFRSQLVEGRKVVEGKMKENLESVEALLISSDDDNGDNMEIEEGKRLMDKCGKEFGVTNNEEISSCQASDQLVSGQRTSEKMEKEVVMEEIIEENEDETFLSGPEFLTEDSEEEEEIGSKQQCTRTSAVEKEVVNAASSTLLGSQVVDSREGIKPGANIDQEENEKKQEKDKKEERRHLILENNELFEGKMKKTNEFGLDLFCFPSQSSVESMDEEYKDSENIEMHTREKTDRHCKHQNKSQVKKVIEGKKMKRNNIDDDKKEREDVKSSVASSSQYSLKKTILTPRKCPPTSSFLMESAVARGLLVSHHTKLFCSNPCDVQLPKDMGNSSVQVRSRMSYDLLPFHPPCNASIDNTHSFLEHWRTIYGLQDTSDASIQALPPSCYPTDSGRGYTAKDHQEDVLTKAVFMGGGHAIITPALPPPTIHISKLEKVVQPIRDEEVERVGSSENEAVDEDTINKNAECGVHLKKLSSSVVHSKPTRAQGVTAASTVRQKSALLCSDNSMIEAATPNNTFGYMVSPSDMQEISHEVQHLTTMTVEIHARSRSSLLPDPEHDPVLLICYHIHDDWPHPHTGNVQERIGILAVDLNQPSAITKPINPAKSKSFEASPQKDKGKSPSKVSFRRKSSAKQQPLMNLCDGIDQEIEDDRPYLDHCGISDNISVTYADTEEDLFNKLVQLVRETDPDILVGYEIQMSSWGYLHERAICLGMDLCGKISRIPVTSSPKKTKVMPAVGYKAHTGLFSSMTVTGRIVLDLWRLMSHEVALTSYHYESVAFHVLHERTPHFSHRTLSNWYQHPTRLFRHRVVEYYSSRCRGNYRLMESVNLIGRTSEMARLYGIEFYNVLSRGSQYRVESMLLRLARQGKYVAVSPSIQQRARMAAPEHIPLIMEPESRFYSDPVLVLDFQSLYPSMVIAHNYCYSTCLGKMDNISKNGEYKFGTCTLDTPSDLLERLEEDVTISPSGAVFVKPHIRRGVMPRMLDEILTTRVMVKQSKKLHKSNRALLRMLDARQLGLKLIANVTYGYTAASYSGRMPCVEVADSIVSKGRETLQRAIQLVNCTPEWRARVVYGDTDSLFVLLEGASKDEAFRVGKEICEQVTADNPKPVKLKFEKVYLPCVLQTKKRYAGYMYESPDQCEPVFDAKGIETVRRDGCPAVAMILEKSLKLLFSTKNISLVKSYVQQQFKKILTDRVSVQNFTFAREYRGRSGYRPGASVPALELAKQSASLDRRTEPRVGERVPYVIVYGSPGLPLIQLAHSPDKVLETPSLRLNGTYYITKQILPALDRVFTLMGVDVFCWYSELPRIQRPLVFPKDSGLRKSTIGQYFTSRHCVLCEQVTVGQGVCSQCRRDTNVVTIALSHRLYQAEWNYNHICQLCQNCCGGTNAKHYLECCSLDCPVLYRREQRLQQLKSTQPLQMSLNSLSPSPS